MPNEREVGYVRDLARRYAELACSPQQEEIRARWRNTYMLRRTDRSPVWLRLDQSAWNELVPESEMACADKWLRGVERQLRIALRQHEFGDDTIMLPYWKVNAAISHTSQHLWGVPTPRHKSSVDNGSWAYDPQIKTMEDLARLRLPDWEHNEQETERRYQQACELFAGILPVRISALPPIFPGLGVHASDLIGLDNLLLNMALCPEFIHKLMTNIRDGIMKCLDQVEAMGILTENNDEPIHFSESLKSTPAEVPVRLSDLWLRTESQQFQKVSPAMWREFCLEYQKPIMRRFRYVSYGCCEDLTDRIDEVLAIPNLRIFVNSPWTKFEKSVAACGDKYCIIWRQKASDIIYAADMAPIKKRLEEGMMISRGCHKAIVLQEVATTAGNPQRLHDWVAMAKQTAERLS